MKKLFIVIFALITTAIYSQTIKIDSTLFTIKHGDITLYLDKDTNTYVSVHQITKEHVKTLDGMRKDKWHNEKPYGPYKRTAYRLTGYDLGHLTPSKITMYDDSTNYSTFSMFNQAPQLAEFNEHPWEQLEMKVIAKIIASNMDATIITGVLYDNYHKTYLATSKIKIPIMYYKILVLSNGQVSGWVGSNINGLISDADTKTILEIARKNGNHLGITISK
jgi:DNA/RNA endonuclease G (NUC1)